MRVNLEIMKTKRYNIKTFDFADFYYKQLDTLKDITIKYSSITDEEYEKHKKDDWWFTSKEGVEHGFIDEIATTLL